MFFSEPKQESRQLHGPCMCGYCIHARLTDSEMDRGRNVGCGRMIRRWELVSPEFIGCPGSASSSSNRLVDTLEQIFCFLRDQLCATDRVFVVGWSVRWFSSVLSQTRNLCPIDSNSIVSELRMNHTLGTRHLSSCYLMCSPN